MNVVCECVKVYVVSICYVLCKCSACVWCVGVCGKYMLCAL